VIALLRVDNRLIHGQVVEAWLPSLKVGRVAVADDEAARSPLVRAAMGLAVPASVEVLIQPVEEMDFSRLSADAVKTLLLVRDVGGVVRAMERGLPVGLVNLGNVHFATGRRQVSPSVFLSPEELQQLRALEGQGGHVEARAVPSDKPVTLTELTERFARAG
jgi:mannose/fructose/N-acetylgalactosamine-specific phosphotransferase system component IIB